MTKTKPPKSPLQLSPSAARCLKSLLEIELMGDPIDVHEWRARNAKKIPLLDELSRKKMIRTDRHFAVTFWGLMNTPGDAAAHEISKCERLFKALRKHYPAHPKEPIGIEELAKKFKASPDDVLQSARFLDRSPAYLGIQGEGSSAKLMPTENYVTMKGFDEVKAKAGEEALRPADIMVPSLMQPSMSGDFSGSASLLNTESEAVRESYQTMNTRTVRDPAGAITAARALVEAVCKHILEEHGERDEKHLELPRLYSKAAAHLQLHPRADVSDALRQVLQGSATIINGLAQMRNILGDAHGKGTVSAKPAKRHARLATSLATAVADFLLETLEAKRLP